MVIVAGASSFLGKHITQALLDKNYCVIGSVRSEEQGEKLLNEFNNAKFSYEIVRDTEVKHAFDYVLDRHQNVDKFIDAVGTIPLGVNYERQLIRRSAKGVIHILQSIRHHAPNVFFHQECSRERRTELQFVSQDPNFVVDESSWNPDNVIAGKESPQAAYFYSKAVSEKEAWSFVDKQRTHFKRVTVLPAYTFGPQCFDVDVSDNLGDSTEILHSIFDLKKNYTIPQIKGLFVDARDVALAHVLALEKEEAIGKRLLLASEEFTGEAIVGILNQHYPALQFPEATVEKIGLKFDNKNTVENLRMESLIPLETSIKDGFDQYLKVKGIICYFFHMQKTLKIHEYYMENNHDIRWHRLYSFHFRVVL
ncbi:uncharacterized protein J8A68_003679 [[Candida] subhashii]|uniref:NAD-dependent epimerase/dehydratase domain-containing protein n=1 Tax=[Candida] subhashii TaxID=561895 RepID=A0A8J5UY40_9ASCO|nr:uncharacterized protein J8A68_003679 [[Candida] subhashii]KAG7662824.1 hypothetical protein J8A68_003679 [[Candida] subhashii]